MKFFETKFEDYVNSCEKKNLHPELNKMSNISKDILFNNNLILYGPIWRRKNIHKCLIILNILVHPN